MARPYPISVHKFGGTSVKDLERIRAVVDVVLSQSDGTRPVVVVSAMAGVTDLLVKAVEDARTYDPPCDMLDTIEGRYRAVAENLDVTLEIRDELYRGLAETMGRLQERLIVLAGVA